MLANRNEGQICKISKIFSQNTSKWVFANGMGGAKCALTPALASAAAWFVSNWSSWGRFVNGDIDPDLDLLMGRVLLVLKRRVFR